MEEVQHFGKTPVCKNGELAVTIFFCLEIAGIEPVLHALPVLFLL